jgi:hypothetical protein
MTAAVSITRNCGLPDRIQARAIRRCGELLGEIEAAKNQHEVAGAGDDTGNPVGRMQAAEEAGLSEHQAKTAIRVANVPADEFERPLYPPSVTAPREKNAPRL